MTEHTIPTTAGSAGRMRRRERIQCIPSVLAWPKCPARMAAARLGHHDTAKPQGSGFHSSWPARGLAAGPPLHAPLHTVRGELGQGSVSASRGSGRPHPPVLAPGAHSRRSHAQPHTIMVGCVHARAPARPRMGAAAGARGAMARARGAPRGPKRARPPCGRGGGSCFVADGVGLPPTHAATGAARQGQGHRGRGAQRARRRAARAARPVNSGARGGGDLGRPRDAMPGGQLQSRGHISGRGRWSGAGAEGACAARGVALQCAGEGRLE